MDAGVRQAPRASVGVEATFSRRSDPRYARAEVPPERRPLGSTELRIHAPPLPKIDHGAPRGSLGFLSTRDRASDTAARAVGLKGGACPHPAAPFVRIIVHGRV